MQRLIRLSLLVVLMVMLSFIGSKAQSNVYVSGRIAAGDVRIFLKDSVYIIDRDYVVAGTLIVEPGTTVQFLQAGRIIDSVGGRIIADGFAKATYVEKPDAVNPILAYEPLGYAHMNYFLDLRNVSSSNKNKTVVQSTAAELTVNPDKYNYIFHVLLDTQKRKIVDLVAPGMAGRYSTGRNTVTNYNNNLIVVSYEQAMMFIAARLNFNPETYDPNLKTQPWRRIGLDNKNSVNIVPQTINFVGADVNNFSREWGHIVVLPGARAAFFRNCTFDHFRKDTTVDRIGFYNAAVAGSQWNAVNAKMAQLTNGAGGVITTFSSRTWLVDCKFTNNMARVRGGALNILQAPSELSFLNPNMTGIGSYAANKNPNLTNKDGSFSSINAANPIPMIDNIDENSSLAEPWAENNDSYRQAVDDGRLAIFLARMRNLTFENNKVLLSSIKIETIGGNKIISDDITNPAIYPQTIGNHAFGGAIYIAGDVNGKNRHIEVAFGLNHSLTIGGVKTNFAKADEFRAIGNQALNYQSSMNTDGSRGGAIYVSRYTSLLVAGEFTNNSAYSKYFDDAQFAGINSGAYSQGGAIFCENTVGRLQLRGEPARENTNPTYFTGNHAGAGGAIFVDGNAYTEMSPIIGGSDVTLTTRDYGFDIKFANNYAIAHGGAILAKRNMTINGSGGVEANAIIGYGGKYEVLFNNNTAGYSGGAIDIRIPNTYPAIPARQRFVQIVRAAFNNNSVGTEITGNKTADVRGGGAIYALNADMNLLKGVEFVGNKTLNGNGGALSMIHPNASGKRYFISDIDVPNYNSDGIVTGFTSVNDIFTGKSKAYPADVQMLTKFVDNEASSTSEEMIIANSGTGTTQLGKGTIPTNLRIYGTKWVSDNTGFAAGLDGLVIKLTNGGNNWEYVNSPTKFRFRDVEYLNSTNVFIGGDRGVIIKTTDGKNWTLLNTGTDKEINDMCFIGSNNGYAVCDGGIILKTTNSGATWTMSQPSINNINSVYFTSSSNGFAVGDNGEVLFTTNGGNTWEFREVNGLNTNLNRVFFKDPSNGYAIGDKGVMIFTKNAGVTWDFATSGTTNALYSMFFVGLNNGYMTGDAGTAFKTVDGGTTWTPMTTNTKYSIWDIHFPSTNVGYFVADAGLIQKTTDAGTTWNVVLPTDKALIDVKRFHQETGLPENGIALGGAMYILDSISVNRLNRTDSVSFNRVRLQNNTAYSGSAIYSDNYDLKLIFNRSLVTGNKATSNVGLTQNVITGPVDKANDGTIQLNHASSDLVGATIYGEVHGPLPYYTFSEAANSMYNNTGRFLIRLPDAPNTKGILAGTTGIGFGGTDTLRGNYWGKTEANVKFLLDSNLQQNPYNAYMETFFVAGDGKSWLPFDYQEFLKSNPADPRKQGPFESVERGDKAYKHIILGNGANQNEAASYSIPENLVFSGRVYDIYDKGTDIKTADYSARRMSPIEDFAVGVPPVLRRYATGTLPSNGKYVKRYIRNPFETESGLYPQLASLQGEFVADKNGSFWHPIGYPLYLETMVNYDGLVERSNHDPRLLNNTMFFIINLNTGDFVRSNFLQVSEDASKRETFRAIVELVPDSSDRNDPSYRRTTEGLANLGSGPELLRKLYQNEYNEDAAALQGRRYTADFKKLARVPALFSNRPMVSGFATMPVSNQVGNESRTTYFAGERFNALPVRVGDSVLVVSRTSLWRDGVDKAAKEGLSFKITESTTTPVFTGDIVKLSTDTIKRMYPSETNPDVKEEVIITEFLNKVFLTEDRAYPVEKGYYSKLGLLGDPAGEVAGGRGRDSILNVTAIDANNFYDPRSLFDADNYSRLSYDVKVTDNAAALNKWLIVNKKPASAPIKDGALGYFELAGRPINPFITPGGDSLTVYAYNYPPNYRSMDALNGLPTAPGKDTVSKFIETYPSYFSNQTYDVTNARFLQQDTVNVGPHYTSSYGFRIFVVDSVPRFIADDEASEEIFRQDDNSVLYVKYEPTVLTCGKARDGRLRANLTDKLRFQIDINTDDEAEDNSPAAAGWDFRYGKTAYGFENKAIRLNPNDTTVFDEIEYDEDVKWDSSYRIVTVRPEWMASDNIYKYGSDTEQDKFATDFTSYGKLNVRIDGATARALLLPKDQFVGSFNTDTLFTIVVNDGHSGVSSQQYGLIINVQPTITTTSLPFAVEDYDYNPTLLDSSRMIKVYDPNFNQKLKYRLIYPSTTENSIAIDPCYPEAGKIDLATLKTTPEWLRINQETGLLYGTPRVKDAPKNVKVTVVVTDEDGLSTYKVYDLEVKAVNHNPLLSNAPAITCIDPNSSYSVKINVKDIDLVRSEKITFKLLDYLNAPLTGMTVTPATLDGNRSLDTAVITLTKTGTLAPDPDGKITVILVATDSQGKTDKLTFRLQVSDATNFTATVRVSNVKGAYQDLVFGTSEVQGTSTGDATDGDLSGKLDLGLCEYELPPVPFKDAFDARWNIPQRNGILRNIYPTAKKSVENISIYRAQFQAGGIDNGSSPLFPVTISWNIKDIPGLNDAAKNPAGSTWVLQDRYSNGNLFTFNMRDPNLNYHIPGIKYSLVGDIASVVIDNSQIDGFVIMYDWISGVEELEGNATATKITAVTPNPVSANTLVKFELVKSGEVTIEVVDALGNVVTTLVNETMNAGVKSVNWNGNSVNGIELSSGAYNVRLISNGVISTYPVMIVK